MPELSTVLESTASDAEHSADGSPDLSPDVFANALASMGSAPPVTVADDALKPDSASTPDTNATDTPASPTAPEADVKADASTQDDDAAEPEARRYAAKQRDELRQQLAERDARIAELEAATAAPDPHQAHIAEMIGDDAEYRRLADLKAMNQPLSLDDEQRLERWAFMRSEHGTALQRHYQAQAARDAESRINGVATALAESAQKVASLPGVDPEIVRSNPDFGAICQHFYEAGKSAEAQAAKDEIERLRGELRAARGAPGPRVAAGGLSTGGVRGPEFDPSASAKRNLETSLGAMLRPAV